MFWSLPLSLESPEYKNWSRVWISLEETVWKQFCFASADSALNRLQNFPRLETEDEVGAQGDLGKVQGHLRIGDSDPRGDGGHVAHLQPDRRRRLRQGLDHQASEIHHAQIFKGFQDL